MVRRAQLRDINNQERKTTQIQQDILCRLSDADLSINDISRINQRHVDCPTPKVVAKDRSIKGSRVLQSPINNFPDYGTDYDGGVTDAVTLEIFSLRRRNSELTEKVETLNNKLTRALECLQSLKRFFGLWIFEGQGESYDQIQKRIRRIESTIDVIEDRMANPAQIERWEKASK
jgi:hypothetical protein